MTPATTPKKKKPAKRPGKPAPAASDAQAKAEQVSFAQVGVNVGMTQKSDDYVIVDLPLDRIIIDPDFNPRSGGPGDTSELEASIKRHGLQNFPSVRPCKETKKDGKFELLAGERRIVACEKIGKGTVPVLVKPSLEGKDDEALAYALAENSEGNRHNLNPVEQGRAFARLRDNDGWNPARISRETGIGHQTVRRCLTLIDGPKHVVEQVASGKLTFSAGVELAKLPTDTYKKVSTDIGDKTASAAEVKSIAKRVAKADSAAGKKPTTKKEAKKQQTAAKQTTWRPAREKQRMLQLLCHQLVVKVDDDEVGTPMWHGYRGAVAALFYDRGDRDRPVPPAEGNATKQEIKMFDDAIKAEAAKYVPPKEEADASA